MRLFRFAKKPHKETGCYINVPQPGFSSVGRAFDCSGSVGIKMSSVRFR